MLLEPVREWNHFFFVSAPSPFLASAVPQSELRSLCSI
jgi:hypothetical protein